MSVLTIFREGSLVDPILRLVGILDKETCQRFREEMETWQTDRGFVKLYLDVSQLHSMDSIGLGIIIFHYSYFKNSGRELVLLNPSGEIKDLLELSCLNRIIPVEIRS